jgi:peptide/nickel transport system substrate-binding protein
MKRWFIVPTVALSMVILLSSYASQAASPSPSTPKKAATSSTEVKPGTKATASPAAEQPQAGGIWTILVKSRSNAFGYPPRVVGADKDYTAPFFDHLIRLGDDGKYQPGLALTWDVSKDGKTITFKLRQGVTFHDGTPFNAQAVKANLDNLIPPKTTLLDGITSVDVVDDYTVKLNLPSYNNLILYHFAINPATYMYSPEALKKNGEDWATTHPVGTGPFMLKDYEPNVSLTAVKNPNYWQKGLPYLDGIKISVVTDNMTQTITLKAGQASAIFNAQTNVIPLREEGYLVQIAPGSLMGMNFDTKNSEIFAKLKVREAMEYAVDKEAICKGPGEGLYEPMYQMVSGTSPDYNKALKPRKYDPAQAKKLLAEAGYPNGFSFKFFILDTSWKDGFVAIQSYLAAVGIKMEINYVNVSAFNLIRAGGKIEKGASAFLAYTQSSNTLFLLDSYWRTDSRAFQYIVRPAGIDQLIDEAKLSRDPAAITKINQQAVKLFYDDATIIPFFIAPRAVVLDKSVQNPGWFIYGDADNNEFGHRTWLKK